MFNLFKTIPPEHSPIYLTNSTTHQKEIFEPRGKKVTIYACGPTVYDHIHIGNLRAYLVPDLLKRMFIYHGYEVKLTINFTDFGHLSDDGDAGEDKMMKGMKRDGFPITLEGMREFAVPYIESFKKDNDRFGNLPADTYARASDYVTEQTKLIQTLEEKGYTYAISDGIYFDISKYPEYGQIGNIDLEAMKAGARVEVNTEKRHPADFALWKKADLGWESKWGQGFPGWHTECVAMAFSTLGKQIDIHTGGEDLQYTHHNGEIAQAECVTGKTFSRYWLHNAFITMSDEKMAKSAGNGFILEDLIQKDYKPEEYRYWMLQSHYRTTANFTFASLNAAKTALTRLKRFVYIEYEGITPTTADTGYETRFLDALHDDLDTPKIIAILHELIKDQTIKHGAKLATIQAIDSVLEIGLSAEAEIGKAELGQIDADDLPEEIQTLIAERDVARLAQNWPESDRLRDTLQHKGFDVSDTPDGTKVTKK